MRAVRVKMRIVKILRIAQVSLRIAHCILHKLYGNRNFEAKELFQTQV